MIAFWWAYSVALGVLCGAAMGVWLTRRTYQPLVKQYRENAERSEYLARRVLEVPVPGWVDFPVDREPEQDDR